LSTTAGRAFSHALATQGPVPQASHLRTDAALVKEHQTLRINLAYRFPPRLAASTTFFGVLFLGVERFFFTPQPQLLDLFWTWKARRLVCALRKQAEFFPL